MKKNKSRVLKVSSKQTGEMKSKRNDMVRTALKPGKRMSKKGKIYWETRKNRSDKNPKKGL